MRRAECRGSTVLDLRPKAPAFRLSFRLLAAAAILVAAVGCGRSSSDARASSGAPQIRLNSPSADSAGSFVEVTGLAAGDLEQLRKAGLTDEAWASLLRVSVKADADAAAAPVGDRPAMLGSYSVQADTIRFSPSFPLDAGRLYEVTFDPARLPAAGTVESRGGRIVAVVGRPRTNVVPSTVVSVVYPSADIVPENQLRLYLQFSAPMSQRAGGEYIHLLDPEGKEIEGPFLPLDVDFWNADRTRYTVFFDPGRVKQGLLPRRQMGPSLQAGHQYTLVVDAGWPDAEGLPLREPFRRQFRVGPPDEQPLKPQEWQIAAPAADTRDPLVVTFPDPLDHGLLFRALGVSNGRGETVDGEVRTEASETRWLFTPGDRWRAGDYRLVALSFLEDLAGNRIGRAFEVDRFDEVDRAVEPESTTVPFRIGSSAVR